MPHTYNKRLFAGPENARTELLDGHCGRGRITGLPSHDALEHLAGVAEGGAVEGAEGQGHTPETQPAKRGGTIEIVTGGNKNMIAKP